SATLLTDRISDTAPITLNGATLNYQGLDTSLVTVTETVGPITLAGGHSTIQSGFNAAIPGATATLVSSNLIRNTGATVNFIGQNFLVGSAANQIIFNQIGGFSPASALVNGILPWAYVQSFDFATYGAGG